MEGAVDLLALIKEAYEHARARGPSDAVTRSLARALQSEQRRQLGRQQDAVHRERLDRMTREVQELEEKPPAVSSNPRLGDLTGRQIGVWRVKRLGRAGGTTPLWVCFCEGCGFERLVTGAQLRSRPPACDACGRRAAK